MFQCSSASRKFLKQIAPELGWSSGTGFSALQRAENSSKLDNSRYELMTREFQCSSASRKFLKARNPLSPSASRRFQCSSASRKFLKGQQHRQPVCRDRGVSVLFSEPKIPQTNDPALVARQRYRFQCSSASRKFLKNAARTRNWGNLRRFQCSSASRKFLKVDGIEQRFAQARFQCSSASRKFLKCLPATATRLT